MFIKNKAKVESRVGCSQRGVMYFRQLLFKSNIISQSTKPAPVALSVASRYALPGYCNRRVWVRGPG